MLAFTYYFYLLLRCFLLYDKFFSEKNNHEITLWGCWMDNLDNKQSQIKHLMEDFCVNHLDAELNSYALNLFETISQESPHPAFRGKSEIWATSIIYVIARLNFLFDKKSDNALSINELCNYFNVIKSTIGNKATQIEKMYAISYGDKKYTKPEIAKSFEFYMTPEGFIVHASYYDKQKTNKTAAELAEEQKLEEMDRLEESRKWAEVQRLRTQEFQKAERERKTAEKKKKEKEAGQLDFFE